MNKEKAQHAAQNDIEKMVVRLKESKVESEQADCDQGATDGLTWALNTASYRDMRVLESVANDFWQNLELDLEPGFELADALTIELKRRLGEDTTRDEKLTDLFPSLGLCNSKAYLSGFVRVATGVWGEAKSQINA